MSVITRAAHAWSRPRTFALLTLGGLVLGAVLGLVARATGQDWLAGTLDTIGTLFTSLLQLTVVPLVFAAASARTASSRSAPERSASSSGSRASSTR